MKHVIKTLLLLTTTVPAVAQISPVPAAVVTDPPRDEKHPARNQQLLVSSGGVGMNGLFFLASGDGAKPTMLLLHGLPGNERNLDLAQAVRRAGWNVLTFTYRGAWGSPGTFSIANAIEDAGAALAFLRSPEAAAKYRVDPKRIVIAGHSMGGFAASATAARDMLGRPAAPLAGLILLDAWDVAHTASLVKAGGEAGRTGFIASLDDIGHSLGPIKAEDLVDEVLRSGERWSLIGLAPALARGPVLTLYATHGIAEENRRVAAAIQRVPGAKVTARELATDHSFADMRIALAGEVVRWLQGLATGGKPGL
jgi:pimeloyl-ACP methyl ester carboxylesterase